MSRKRQRQTDKKKDRDRKKDGQRKKERNRQTERKKDTHTDEQTKMSNGKTDRRQEERQNQIILFRKYMQKYREA